MGMSLTMSTVSTAETSTTGGSDHVSMPPEMIRITSSLEDLSTVPEGSTSKETATKSLDEYELSKQTLSLSFSKLSPSSSRDALARAQSELREEFQEDAEELTTTKSNRSMGSATSTSTKSNEEKLKYETAINSLKDQVALANRLAKLRLDEIQRLESTMDEMRDNREQADIIRDLNHQLSEIKAQKDKDLEDMKQTMERRIDEIRKEMETRESPSSRSTGKSSPDRVVQVQQEIDQVKAKLEEKALDVELERQLHQLTDELSNVKRELAKKSRELSDIRKENEELQSVSSSRSMSESEELLRVKEELADLTEKLAITSQSLSDASGESRTYAAEQNLRPLLDGSRSGRPPMAESRGITRSRSHSPNARWRQLDSNNIRLQQEKERLTEENAKLSKKLDARLIFENDVNQKELELLRNEVLRLKTENDEASRQLSAYSKDLDGLRRKAEDGDSEMTNATKEKQALAARLSDMTKEHQTETTALKSENAKLREALDEYCAVEEAMQITSNEQELLREKLQEAKAKLDEADSVRERAISILRSEHDERIKTLKAELQRVRSGTAAEIAQLERDKKQTLAKLNEEHKNDISRLKEQAFAQNETSALEERLFECQKHLEESRTEIARLNEAVHESEQASKREIDAVQEKLLEVIQQNEQLRQQNSHFNDKMKTAEESHNKQFEELLGQLDLVEADHIETIGERNKVIADKEAAISTLASQLADALNKVKELGQNVTDEQNARKSVEQRRQESETLVKSQRKEITVLKQTHETFVSQAAKLQEEACQEAREEMIRKAESQFQQANQHYIKLRKQFEESQLKVKRLETQSRAAKKASDELLMEKETVEADLKAQVATLLAAKAKLEADNARRVKDHRRELEDSLQCVADLEERIEAAETGRQALIDQRDKAVRDYEDMKGFSEELMTMLEAGKDGEGTVKS
jgi:chromosome segregation ATPase